MKRLYYLLAVTLFISATNLYGESNFSRITYIKFGYSVPTWNSYGIENKSMLEEDVTRYGGTFQLGNIFYINKIGIADVIGFGINTDGLDLTINAFAKGEDFHSGTHLSSNIGPLITVAPVSNLYIDIFSKLNINWLTAVASSYIGGSV